MGRRGLLGASLALLLSAATIVAPALPTAATNALPSGGVAVAYHGGGRIVTGATGLPTAQLYDTGSLTEEPTIGVTRNGVFFIDTVNSAGTPRVIRSADQAVTWTDVSPKHPITNDPILYVDPVTSRVFSDDYALACHLFSYSANLGSTWTTEVTTCNETDHQNVFAGPVPRAGATTRGYPNVVYSCGNSGGIGLIFFSHFFNSCSKSLNGGKTFAPTGLPPFVDTPSAGSGDGNIPGNCNADIGHGYVGPDGTVYVPKGWCGQPWLAISRNEGLTWTRVQVASNGEMAGPENAAPIDPLPVWDRSTLVFEHEGAVAADAAGNVYYAWVARNRHIYLAVSRNGGRSFGAPLDATMPGLTQAAQPSLDVGDSGRVVLAYMGSSNAPGSPFPDDKDCILGALLCRAHAAAYANSSWNGYLTMTVDALSADPTLFGQSVNDTSHPMLRGGPCGPVRCLQELDFIDVVVAPDGTAWAAYVDACGTTTQCQGIGEAVIGRLAGGPSLCGGLEPTMSACKP